MDKKLLQIINHYGIDNQLRQFTEEYFELTEAIIHKQTMDIGIFGKEHIAEEIADCLVMLEQFRLYYNIPLSEVKKIGKYKVDRQLERIANEDKVS